MMSIGILGSTLWLPVALSVVAFGSFGWAVRGHFETGARIPDGMRLLSLFSLLSYAAYLGILCWWGCEMAVWTVLGEVGFVFSIILFWWTVVTTRGRRLHLAYTNTDPNFLCTSGPYALVRHPFYLSYILFWIGTGLVARGWQWMSALTLTLWYVRIARGEEIRFQSSPLSTTYRAYQARTGMMLPRLGPSRHS
jgi:protein-S-isoprenylcysteine O-methyltransferase Ste14